jgi:succinate-acetate transporter protein
MIYYLSWIPALIIYYSVYAYLSKQCNDNFTWGNFWWFYAMNLLPIWMFVARYSKNILFDALVYDLIIFFTFYFVMLALGSGDKFHTGQWVGLSLVIAGFLVMKLF